MLAAVVVALLVMPAAADAHGPVDPPASSYLARITTVPTGLQAKVVDGDQRMWLSVATRATVVVLDYSGAPYLRFSPAGVQVNHNSPMYYLNQVPAELIPSGLTPRTAPSWQQVSGGHSYEWHDGRLHALATIARAPGATFVGRWTVPVRVNGAAAAIAGVLDYSPNPSIVWFWPIAVALACALAGLRVRRAALDIRIARGLAAVALIATTVAAAGQQLHGRPNVSIGQLIVLALLLAFVAWAAKGLAQHRDSWLRFFLIGLVAVFEGATLIGVLLHGFVLIALPPVIARLAVTACLAAGCALVPAVFRLAEQIQRAPRRARVATGEGAAADQDQEDPAAVRWEG